MKLCDVCGKREVVGVASSATGPISFAYCAECAKSGREPYGAVVASLFGISDIHGIAGWYFPIVMTTLAAEGKSVEELFADVNTLEKEYMESMRKARKKHG